MSVTPGIRSTMPLSVKVLYPQVMKYIPSCRAATTVPFSRYNDVAMPLKDSQCKCVVDNVIAMYLNTIRVWILCVRSVVV